MSKDSQIWAAYLKGFKAYLQLERSMSDNTVEAYLRDVQMLGEYIYSEQNNVGLTQLEQKHLQAFLAYINELELTANTQARVLSGIKAFFRYLMLEEVVRTNPTELLEAPKLKRALPVFLSVEEIDQLFAAIDHSTPEGQRNRAMLD